MALLNAQTALSDAVPVPEEVDSADQGLASAEATWTADEAITVGSVQTLTVTSGVANTAQVATGAQAHQSLTTGGSGPIEFRTGTADGTNGSGNILIATGSSLQTGIESGDIQFVNGTTPSGTQRGQLLRQDSEGNYNGVIGSQGIGSRALETLDAAVIGGTETVFDLNSAQTLTIPADFFKVGTTVRFRVWVTANDPGPGANVVIIRVRLGGLTGVLVGQNLTTYDPGSTGEVVILDGAFTIRTLGATGTMVSSCMSTSGVPGGTVAMAPYALQSTTIDTTVQHDLVVTCQFTDTTATTAVLQNYVCDAFI